MRPTDSATPTPTPTLESGSPRPSVAEMRRRLGEELSPVRRGLYALLLLADVLVAVVVASLWLTEPDLPLRTHVAFAAMLVVAVGWAVFFSHTLTRRKVLFARQRLTASWLALLACSAFTLGALALAVIYPEMRSAALTATALGGTLVVAAGLLLIRARQRWAELWQRREQLERQLAVS